MCQPSVVGANVGIVELWPPVAVGITDEFLVAATVISEVVSGCNGLGDIQIVDTTSLSEEVADVGSGIIDVLVVTFWNIEERLEVEMEDTPEERADSVIEVTVEEPIEATLEEVTVGTMEESVLDETEEPTEDEPVERRTLSIRVTVLTVVRRIVLCASTEVL